MQPISTYKAIEHNLARIIHWVLIIAIVVMPISGFIDKDNTLKRMLGRKFLKNSITKLFQQTANA